MDGDYVRYDTDARMPVTAPRVRVFLRKQPRCCRGQEVGHQSLSLGTPARISS